MIKKIVGILVSIMLFVILTVVSFNLSGKDETPVQVVPKPSSTAQTSNPVIKPSKEPISGDLVITDLSVLVVNNEVKLTWTNPDMSNISNLRIIRTPSKSEGESAVYNITDTKGKFTDKNVKPGIRYYYEIVGKIRSANIYSGIVCAELSGKIILSTDATYMTVNGEEKFYDASKKSKPYIHGETIMVPLKGVGDLLGGSVYWVTENNKTNTKSAVLKFRKTEIELFVGKKSIIVNRKEKDIDFAPTIKDGVLYAPYTIISDYMICSVKKTKGILTIEKPIDEPSSLENVKPIIRDLSVMEDEDFEIALIDPSTDGKKWYYKSDVKDSIDLKSKIIKDDKDGITKNIFTFNSSKKGEYKFILKYFNPRLGENYSEQTLIYTIKVTPKQ